MRGRFFLLYFIFAYRHQEIMNWLNNWVYVEMKTSQIFFCCFQLFILIQKCCQEYAIKTKIELSNLKTLRDINDVTTTTCYLECTKEKHWHKFSMKINETVNRFKGYCTLYKKFRNLSNLGYRYNTLVYAYKRVSTSIIMFQYLRRKMGGFVICHLFLFIHLPLKFSRKCACVIYWLRHPNYCWSPPLP